MKSNVIAFPLGRSESVKRPWRIITMAEGKFVYAADPGESVTLMEELKQLRSRTGR